MSLFAEFIHHLDSDNEMKLNHAPKKVEVWLKKLDLPESVLNCLLWPWPQVDSYIGHISLMSSANIMKSDHNEQLLLHGFLQLGSAPNGDLFVVDFLSDPALPGFVSHEHYWGYKMTPREIFEPIANSLESLLYRLAEKLYVPADYFAAKDFNEFLREEKARSNPRRAAAIRKSRKGRHR